MGSTPNVDGSFHQSGEGDGNPGPADVPELRLPAVRPGEQLLDEHSSLEAVRGFRDVVTPNLAARLQGIAEPNAVVIAESTRRLLGNLFQLEDLGARHLKGIAGPMRAYAALRASSAEGRFEALHASGLTALVGREEELELLSRRRKLNLPTPDVPPSDHKIDQK